MECSPIHGFNIRHKIYHTHTINEKPILNEIVTPCRKNKECI